MRWSRVHGGQLNNRFVTIHGHFYQPPREEPRSGVVTREHAAGGYHDWNERILAECYQPNAELGNFGRMSFNIGPTLAAWMRARHPKVLAGIVGSDQAALVARGAGAALAQPYHHTILPLANERDRQTELRWGVRSFELLYGRRPVGVWLPETAVNTPTLDACAAEGLRFTILAPGQISRPAYARGTFRLALPSGAPFEAVVYDGGLSGLVSFDSSATDSAERFAIERLRPLFANTQSEPTLLPVATDGEVYGHHHRFKDLFLDDLLRERVRAAGMTPITAEQYVLAYPATHDAVIHERSSWGCAHGLARWSHGCSCTMNLSTWKAPLRRAFERLAASIDAVYETEGNRILRDPWAARDAYVDVVDGALPFDDWIGAWKRDGASAGAARALLEAQRHRLAMFASCAFYWDDVDRLEPGYGIQRGLYAAELLERRFGGRLRAGFIRDLGLVRGWRSPLSAAQLHAHEELAAD